MKREEAQKTRLVLTYLLASGLLILGNMMYSDTTYTLSSNVIVSALVIGLVATVAFWFVWNFDIEAYVAHQKQKRTINEAEILKAEAPKRKKSIKEDIIGTVLSEISDDDLLSLRKFIAEKKVILEEDQPTMTTKNR